MLCYLYLSQNKASKELSVSICVAPSLTYSSADSWRFDRDGALSRSLHECHEQFTLLKIEQAFYLPLFKALRLAILIQEAAWHQMTNALLFPDQGVKIRYLLSQLGLALQMRADSKSHCRHLVARVLPQDWSIDPRLLCLHDICESFQQESVSGGFLNDTSFLLLKDSGQNGGGQNFYRLSKGQSKDVNFNTTTQCIVEVHLGHAGFLQSFFAVHM